MMIMQQFLCNTLSQLLLGTADGIARIVCTVYECL
jgi:hypothetical protein